MPQVYQIPVPPPTPQARSGTRSPWTRQSFAYYLDYLCETATNAFSDSKRYATTPESKDQAAAVASLNNSIKSMIKSIHDMLKTDLAEVDRVNKSANATWQDLRACHAFQPSTTQNANGDPNVIHALKYLKEKVVSVKRAESNNFPFEKLDNKTGNTRMFAYAFSAAAMDEGCNVLLEKLTNMYQAIIDHTS